MTQLRLMASPMAWALLAGGIAWGQEPGDAPLVRAMEDMIQRAAEKAAPSTVAVWVEREEEDEPGRPRNPFRLEMFGKRPKNAPASGTIVESDGLILTSCFNVGGKVKKIKVTLADGQEKEAELVGFHAGADVALLKIDASGLPTLRRSPLNAVKVGAPVVAVGRAPDGKGLCVNPGIVSALARLAGRAVQSDAKMNYGNVGGPLVDAEGRMIGVTCKVDTKSAGSLGQNSGVSFAVTWDQINSLLPELKKGSRVHGTGQPFLGVGPGDKEDPDGVIIGTIVPGGSAEGAGLKQGDLVMSFDGQSLKSFDDLRILINKKAVGDEVKVKVRRGDEELEFTIKLGERPGD